MNYNVTALVTEVLMGLLNEEQTPGEIAKAHGLVYGGFAQWIDPKTRETKAITKDGKFVWKDGGNKPVEKDLGKLVVFNIDESLASGTVPDKSKFLEKYTHMLKKAIESGNDFLLLTPLGGEEAAAKFLVSVGISSGVKLKPIGSGESQKIHDFLKLKIKEGYKQIVYFDKDKKNISAVESLRATFNRKGVSVKTYHLPSVSRDVQQN